MSALLAIRSVTFDTNVLPASRLKSRAEAIGISVSIVTVTRRETEGTSLGEEVSLITPLVENAVWGESRYGESRFATDENGVRLEAILRHLSNGAFPPPGRRESLSRGQRRQLRDAMILSAHVSASRDVLVTNDARAFVDHGRRELLEALLSTRIMLQPEFEQYLDAASGLDAV